MEKRNPNNRLMKKCQVVVVFLLLCSLSLCACLPSDTVSNEDYFISVIATSLDGGSDSIGIARFSNADETDIPFATYTKFTAVPGTIIAPGIGDIVTLFDQRKIIGFCCMVQAAEDCEIEVEIIGVDWLRIFSLDDISKRLGYETVRLRAGEKYCMAFEFEYDMSDISEAEEDEEYGELSSEEQDEKIGERLAAFFVIKVSAINDVAAPASLRLDSFIFRIVKA